MIQTLIIYTSTELFFGFFTVIYYSSKMEKNPGNLVNFSYSKKVMFLFSMLLCFFIILWFLQYFYYFADDFNTIMSVSRRKNMIEHYPKNSKYILVWNKYHNILNRFGIRNGLLNCSSSDCVFTDDKNLLYDYISFDGIIFDEIILNSSDRPKRRSKFQSYIFGSQKSSDKSPACELYNDNFFNLTFTYRIDSDVLWSYIAVRNSSGAVVAPKATVEWEKSVIPVSSKIRSYMIQKKRAAIWVVNNNQLDETNVEYITRLQEHLFYYSLKIDVYGQAPSLTCPNNNCQKLIRDKYYFYMAFENSFSIDLVTDVVLNGYNNYAVPVVYGGANYSRFLPPGSYINAWNFHPWNLAHLMHQVINDPTLFESYFRWTNLYTIQDNSKSLTTLCNLCDTIHGYRGRDVTKTAIKEFRRWWNGLNGMKRCLPQAYWREKDNLKARPIFH